MQTTLLRLASFTVLSALVLGCGGGGSTGSGGGSAGSTPDIANGATLGTATSHWATNPCQSSSGRICFAANGLGEYVDGFTRGKQTFTWTMPNSSTVLMNYVLGPCIACMASITNVSGGVSAGQMTGQGWRGDGHTSGMCTFTLVGGPIP